MSDTTRSEMSPGEAWEAGLRENQLAAMAEAGQKLAVRWGHQPWSDSWARLVAETLDEAAANANHWTCECGDQNGLHEAFCYRCGACQPDEGEHECTDVTGRDAAFDAFLGGYEAICDEEIDMARVRAGFDEWLRR